MLLSSKFPRSNVAEFQVSSIDCCWVPSFLDRLLLGFQFSRSIVAGFRVSSIDGCWVPRFCCCGRFGGSFVAVAARRPLSLSREVQAAWGPKQGANPTEVYGFVGAISTLVALVVFLMWAYLPEPWLQSMGITYYPNRYWAMAIPAYVLVALVFVVSFYSSLNYMATPSPCSLNTLFDEYTRSPRGSQLLHEADRPIHAISDVPVTTVNALVFGASYHVQTG